MTRRLLISFMAITLPFAFMLIAAEIVLRFLPVASILRVMPVTAESPVFRFLPNQRFVFSRGWDFDMVNRGRINNAGWINDQDYEARTRQPLLAVIGDSYVQALMVPYRDTLHGRLAREYAGRLSVYSFGAAGAALSQYLIWAQHAVREYGAKAIVINVVGNDFDESHIAYKQSRGFWHFSPDKNGELHLELLEFRPSWKAAFAINSALTRYLIANLGVLAYSDNLRHLYYRVMGREQERYAGNTAATVDAERVRHSLAVIDAFFRDLPVWVELPPERVLFTVDGFRYPEAAAKNSGSYFALMRRAFIAKAKASGYEAIDLDRWFFPLHRARGTRFEFPHDGHWNAAGHAVAAEAVRASNLLARLTAASVVAN
jgi:hypothetical protein